MRLVTVFFFLVGASLTAFSAETPVHMLVSGFVVRELPIHLSNINNLRFAPDGRLTALGYDGRIHLLRDTDGDGLEDTADLFWKEPSLRVPVGMAWTKQGLYVSSHKKVSFLRDRDGDGKADTEEVIASGWPPTDANTQGVDATAVTVDEEGNVYFALLVADYANAYRLKDGIARYDLNSPRGTIQKWSPKTRQLETIATGLRVPYTLAFNRYGDLFVTDQEGETWMPNGNPVDELNHIIPGRNYGFPPPHPEYLPNLISEPPVVGFGPQHQSTCGLVFNERIDANSTFVKLGFGPARGSFGPAWWEGDAFVAGESRGKIWRVRLVKTPAGYVGKQTLIAALSMLTTDVTVSPGGDLYVSCHSGPPDWGTGPQGEGKIFKISYHDHAAPQSTLAWSQSPWEVRVAFDRPLAETAAQGLIGREIEFGEFVRAADRFEVLKPPYQVVKFQQGVPKGKLKITAARLLENGSVLGLSTDPHSQPVSYSLSLPSASGDRAIDLGYDLDGCQVEWEPADAASGKRWEGWLPHLDTAVAAAFTSNSAPHLTLASRLHRAGRLRCEGQLLIPGAPVELSLTGTMPFTMTKNGLQQAAKKSGTAYQIKLLLTNSTTRFTFEAQTGPGFKIETAYRLDKDSAVRPVPLSWFRVPWAASYTPMRIPEGKPPELAGGDWKRGKALFTGEQLKCASCHRIRDEGASLAPDLSNLSHRDAASVLRDIREPNLTINPDFVAYRLTLPGDEELTGFVHSQTENALRVILSDGKERLIDRSAVRKLEPAAISLMPAGLLDGLSDLAVRDLLVFLLNPPPLPGEEKPPKRTSADLDRVLRHGKTVASAGVTNRSLRLTLVASRQDHPVNEHDYPQWQHSWVKLWERVPGITVSKAWLWPSQEQLVESDVLIFFYWNRDWTLEKFAALDSYLQRGGGMVLLHSSCITDQNPEQLAERIGLAAQPVRTKYRHGALDLRIAAPDHPIMRGFEETRFVDETYWPMIGDVSQVEVLANSEEEGKWWPMVWTFNKGRGRVFGTILGHYTSTHEDPLFRLLAVRAVAWAAGENTERFENLVAIPPDP